MLLTLSLLAVPAAAGSLTLSHDVLTRRLRSEIPSGAIEYKDDRIIIRGAKLLWKFSVTCYFSRASGRTRLVAEELRVNGQLDAARLAQADAKLSQLVDELPADLVEVKQGGRVKFRQELE